MTFDTLLGLSWGEIYLMFWQSDGLISTLQVDLLKDKEFLTAG